MIVLGIESSCDETSVAIVQKKKKDKFGKILSENTLSQIKQHQKFGGVVPELASREHSNNLDNLVKKTIYEAGIKINLIDAFCATLGPGLLGGLLIGSNYAKSLAVASNKPFFAINHLQGHLLIPRINQNINFPFLCLLVSGGHTQILISEKFNKFSLLGETLDDALGEVFDKVAKLLGYDYPGGPIIEKLATKVENKKIFNLPMPMINNKTMDLSFSGIKTSVRNVVNNSFDKNLENQLCFEFQNCVTNCLLSKCETAIRHFKKTRKSNSFIFAGGVASNDFIRTKLKELCKNHKMNFIVPEKKFCVDNASMIAWAAMERLVNGDKSDSLDIAPKPRWELESL